MKIRKVFIPLIFCAGLIGMVSCSNEKGSSPFISTDENQGEDVTITLELQGGNYTLTSVKVKKGEALSLVEVPTKEGAEFAGWYYDKDYKLPYQSEDVFEEDTTLYAKYEEVQLINSVEDFLAIKVDGNYKLNVDLDFNNQVIPCFTDYDNPFIGTFDGNNHTIKNYKMDERTYNGLFGYVEGTIKNLKVSTDIEINVSDTVYCGLIAGYLNKGTIENCYGAGFIRVSNKHSLLSSYCGGIVARNESGVISSCYSNVLISNNAVATAYSGSICAYSGGGETQTALIENCFANEGSVYAVSTSTEGSAYAGGIVGFNFGLVNKCFTTNLDINARTKYYHCFAAGIVADNNGGRITNSFSSSKVETTSEEGDTFRGGITGRNFRSSQLENSGTLENCYSYENQKVTFNSNNLIKNRHHQVVVEQVSLEQLKTASWYKEVLGFDSPYLIKNDYFPSLNSSFKKISLTEETPIMINSVDELLNMNMTKSYKLNKDLVIDSKNFKSIGTYNNPFYGILDGNNHTITFTNIEDVNIGYNGLFGYFNGTVKNLKVKYNATLNTTTDDTLHVAPLVAYLIKGYVLNCSSEVHVITSTPSIMVGGLVSYNEDGTIDSSFVKGTIKVSSKEESNYVGGLLAINDGGIVKESFADVTLNVSGVKTATVGGLIGKNNSLVQDCYAHVSVNFIQAEKTYIGGLVGINFDLAKLVNTYAKSTYEDGNNNVSVFLRGGLTGSNTAKILNSYYYTSLDIYSSGHSPVVTEVQKVSLEELETLSSKLGDKFYDDSYPHLIVEKEEN